MKKIDIFDLGMELLDRMYELGKRDAIEDFATNLVGEISDYESAGHNIDVIRWVEYYKAEMLKEVE